MTSFLVVFGGFCTTDFLQQVLVARAQNCMRDIRLLVQATDTQPRAMYCYVRDRTARASYSQLVEYVTKDAVQYVALHDAVLFRRQRAQRRWNAVKRLSVRVNAAAAAFREVYAHVLYQPGGRGAQEACESFQEGCESCGRPLLFQSPVAG